MLRRDFLFSAVAAVSLLATAPAIADPLQAKSLVERVTSEVVALIKSPGDAVSKESQFRSILSSNADMRQIAGFATGRYARSMSSEQKARYVNAFVDRITRTYVRRFGEYSGEKIQVDDAMDLGRRGYLVQSRVFSGSGQPFAVSWNVSDRSGSLKIADIVIEGVSLAQQQRDEITAMIDQKNGDIDAFLASF